jgi:hypothetical protein
MAETNTISAIQTEYKGYRFRSRLEARWAVFFDACGIKWEYEPEGFEVEFCKTYIDFPEFDTCRYLPDFYFPDFDLYGEVKSKPFTEDEKEKMSYCIDYLNTPVSNGLVLLGNIPRKELFDPYIAPYQTLGFKLVWWHEGVVGGFIRLKISEKDDECLVFDCPTTLEGKDEYCNCCKSCGAPDFPWDTAELYESSSWSFPSCVWDKEAYILTDKYFDIARQARFEYGETPNVKED